MSWRLFNKSVTPLGDNLKIHISVLFTFIILMLVIFSEATTADENYLKDPNQVNVDELNALVILSSGQGPIFFSQNAVQSISAEIRLIKSKFSEVAQINDLNADPPIYSVLSGGFKPEAIERMESIVKKAAKSPGKTVDITHFISFLPDIKALNDIVPITSVKYEFFTQKTPSSIDVARIKLSYLVNLNALINATKPYHDFEYLEAARLFGDSDHINRSVVSKSKIRYTFSQGGGDCPSGCTIWNVYNFDLIPHGKNLCLPCGDLLGFRKIVSL